MQLKGAVTMRKRLFICLLITLVVFTGCKKDKEYQVLSVAMGHSCFDCDLTFKSFEIKKDIELNKTITLFGNTVDLEYYFSGFNSKLIPLDTYNVKYINGVPCKDESRYICFTPDVFCPLISMFYFPRTQLIFMDVNNLFDVFNVFFFVLDPK